MPLAHESTMPSSSREPPKKRPSQQLLDGGRSCSRTAAIPSWKFCKGFQPLIPCELCDERLEPGSYSAHVTKHGQLYPREAEAPLSLLPCEVCEDLFLPSEYEGHLQKHVAASQIEELRTQPTPVARAACWIQQVRSGAEEKGVQQACVANFDLAVSFADRAIRQTSFLSPELAMPKVVHHWTPTKNFESIVNSNLCVPDRKKVFHQTDEGCYGAGIYTSPDFHFGTSYARNNGGCFMCLGLPGRQWPARKSKDYGVPRRRNYDTHISPNKKEWVFFASDQLLPCFWVELQDTKTQSVALELVEALAASIRKDLRLELIQSDGTKAPEASARNKKTRRTKHR
ncbi:tsuA [Symbiodinium sp. KB8]|nr:tsuA [Symbiodinium sp. KB8]